MTDPYQCELARLEGGALRSSRILDSQPTVHFLIGSLKLLQGLPSHCDPLLFTNSSYQTSILVHVQILAPHLNQVHGQKVNKAEVRFALFLLLVLTLGLCVHRVAS